ncbi:MAG: hypothetical protein WD623_05795 [Marinobacter sp.]|uniref:hypothetical protein n=1 Tax=Marinobacter sp. TaxID=50741 RepID=UPI0034A01CDD
MLLLFAALNIAVMYSAGALAHGADEIDNVPDGVIMAQLAELPDISGLQVILLDGVPQGIMVSYQGSRELVVSGLDGEPFLRFDSEGVLANTGSATWRVMQSTDNKAAPDEGWLRVSETRSFGWMDPRLSLESAPHHGSQPQELERWHINVRIEGENSDRIGGVIYWQPLQKTSPRSL